MRDRSAGAVQPDMRRVWRRWGWRSRWVGWLLAPPLLACLLFLAADRIWPLALPDEQGARIVLARDGTPLWRFAEADGTWRYPVTIAEVSPLYREALLAYEDRWFLNHPGINPLAIARAAWQNLTSGEVVSGGSTLTMQVARLLHPHARTLGGKLAQVFRALQLEWHLDKDAILTLYLDRAPFGGTLQGVAAASWSLLGKPPTRLTHAEAALLVVLPQAPSRLRPDRYPARAQAARDKVLQRMADLGVWSAEVVREAREEAVMLAPRDPPGLAPLLARRVIGEVPGARVTTTLDAGLQRRVEGLVRAWRVRLPPRSSLAVLVAEHEDMAVRAYVGSLDFADEQRFGHVDMVRALRSPGSTLKPFLIGMALDAGLIHSESLLQDVPRRHASYRPGNFASGFSGPVSVSEALARSLNLPMVQLLEALGARHFVAGLRDAGLNLRLPDQQAPSLAVILGGIGTSLEDLVTGYRAFARDGLALRPYWRQDVVQTAPRRMLSPGAAWIVRETLLGWRASGQRLATDAAGRPGLAWKTGTSYGYRDAWAVGVGPRHVIGVWVGRPDGTPVAAQFGVASAAPLLFQLHDMLAPAGGHRDAESDPPPSVSLREVCWPGGQTLPSGDPDCLLARRAWVLDGVVPPTLSLTGRAADGALDLVHWVDQDGLRVAPDCPGATRRTMRLWPAALEPWLPVSARREARLPAASATCPPPHNPLDAPALRIVGVSDGDLLRLPAGRTGGVPLVLQGEGGVGRRWWFHNGARLAETPVGEPLPWVVETPGEHELGVIDEAGNVARVGFSVLATGAARD